jgi:hypothetical protein
MLFKACILDKKIAESKIEAIDTILRKSIQNAILSYYIRRHLSHYIFRVILQSSPARSKVHLFVVYFPWPHFF